MRSPVAALVAKLAIGATDRAIVGVLAARSIARLGLLDLDLRNNKLFLFNITYRLNTKKLMNKKQ